MGVSLKNLWTAKIRKTALCFAGLFFLVFSYFYSVKEFLEIKPFFFEYQIFTGRDVTLSGSYLIFLDHAPDQKSQIRAPLNKLVQYTYLKDLKVSINGAPATINQDGTWTYDWHPSHPGVHVLNIKLQYKNLTEERSLDVLYYPPKTTLKHSLSFIHEKFERGRLEEYLSR